MNKDGLHSYCKPCQNAKCAQYQKNSVAAKQDSRASIESPFEAPADQPFSSHKVSQKSRTDAEYRPYRHLHAVQRAGLSTCQASQGCIAICCMSSSNRCGFVCCGIQASCIIWIASGRCTCVHDNVCSQECKACHELRPLDGYYRSATNKDGLVSKCKRCMAQSNQRKVCCL